MNEPTSLRPDAATATFNLPDYRVTDTEVLTFGQRQVRVEAKAEAGCPSCGMISTRVLACHQNFTRQTHILAYFCEQASPWQRGSNENTNGLLRQYFRKEQISASTPANTWLWSPPNSISDHVKSSDGRAL